MGYWLGVQGIRGRILPERKAVTHGDKTHYVIELSGILLAQLVTCLSLVREVRGSIPGAASQYFRLKVCLGLRMRDVTLVAKQ